MCWEMIARVVTLLMTSHNELDPPWCSSPSLLLGTPARKKGSLYAYRLIAIVSKVMRMHLRIERTCLSKSMIQLCSDSSWVQLFCNLLRTICSCPVRTCMRHTTFQFYRTLLQLFGVERFYRTGYLLQNCSVERILWNIFCRWQLQKILRRARSIDAFYEITSVERIYRTHLQKPQNPSTEPFYRTVL